MPEEVGYRTKNQLALELVGEALERGLPKAPVLADSDYGDDYGFRAALRELGCAYAVAVEPRAKAWLEAPPALAPGDAGRQALPPCLRHVPWRRSPFLYPQAATAASPFGKGPRDPCGVVSPGWRSGPLTATPSASTGANEAGMAAH